MSNALLQKVHSQIKREKVIDLTQKLIRINSEFEKDAEDVKRVLMQIQASKLY